MEAKLITFIGRLFANFIFIYNIYEYMYRL